MRAWTSLAACALTAVLASPALAQTAKGFGGVSSTAIVNQPTSVGAFSNKTVIGQSAFPTAENMPGLSYLQAFGFSQSQAQASPTSTPAKKKKRFPAWLYSRPYTSN